jgi:endonuclease/exonuclease/phosphatase family metal-dependent hydrolase
VREKQFTDISEKLLKPYEKANVPQFIVGDLNTPCDDEVNYKEMLSLLNAEDKVPAKTKARLKDLITWGGKDNDLFDADYERTPQLLDYILVKSNGTQPEWVEKTIEVIQQAWNKGKTKKDLSDHYAVSAVVCY